MIPPRTLLSIVRILRPPRSRPQKCQPAYWNLWTQLRIRLIGEPTLVASEAERQRIRTMPKAGFYAVKVGRKPGIYDTWAETTAQVDGFPSAKHKKFKSRVEAEAYLAESASHPPNGNAVAGPSRSSQTSSASAASRSSRQSATGSGATRARSTSPLSSIPTAEVPVELKAIADKGYVFSQSANDPKGKARLVVYCDGSGIGNGKVGARAGAGVWWGAKGEAARKCISQRVPGSVQTNNRGELLAVILAVEHCPYPHLPLEIRTDSQYTIGCMTHWLPKWLETNFRLSGKSKSKSKPKPFSANGHGNGNGHEHAGEDVKNADMIKHLLVLLRRRNQGNGVRFKYVPAHAGVEGNEEADRLAKLGAGMPAILDRVHWLDPELNHDPPASASSGLVNIDFEIDANMLMTPDEMAAFDIAPDEEF